MLFSFSIEVVTDIIHAKAALELLSVTDEETRTLLAPLLDRERPEPLGILIENTFAEIILELLPYINPEGALPELSTPSGSALMQLDLRLPSSFPCELARTLRRHIEACIADRVLADALSVLIIPKLAAVTLSTLQTMISSARERHEAVMRSILSILHCIPAPFVRARGY